MPESTKLEEITNVLLGTRVPAVIPSAKVSEWMNSPDIEALGALFRLLHKPQVYGRVRPPLTIDDYRRFHVKYYERCLRENHHGEWSDSRYTAAHSLVAWFKGLWSDPQVPREALGELKDLLARLYRDGETAVQTCIITGVLEHLFEDRSILRFFSDWKEDPLLAQAHLEAQGYARSIRRRSHGV